MTSGHGNDKQFSQIIKFCGVFVLSGIILVSLGSSTPIFQLFGQDGCDLLWAVQAGLSAHAVVAGK